MDLDKYHQKRDFSKTPEPKGKEESVSGYSRFVVQRHRASRLHYDLRLEMDGVLKSWAVPKGPSMNPNDKRLSIHTEDHPLDYLTFEGSIPKGNYGAGKMTIWDSGSFSTSKGQEHPVNDQYKAGNLKIEFFGKRLKGSFALVHTKHRDKDNQWLLIKKQDDFATELQYDAEDLSSTKAGKTKELDIHQVIKPMLATKAKAIFSDPDWIYEIKWDGYRMMANINQGTVQLYSRNGISFNQKFSQLHTSLKAVPHQGILDGEVVVVGEDGVPIFQALQHYGEDTKGELRYYVFDILFFNGHDMTQLPLTDRKSLIESVIEDLPMVYYCDHISSMGHTFYERAIGMGLEGVMAKKANSTYTQGGRSDQWLKIRSIARQEVIICGYTASEGALFGSLILGLYKEGELTYCGNCGSGFTDALQKVLLDQFKSYIRKDPPFAKKVNLKGRKPIWMHPELICEVNFSEWTSGGSMRQPVFKGMRTDKLPREIHQEDEKKFEPKKQEEKAPSGELLKVNGYDVPISNLDKVYWPEEGITKYDLIDYYLKIAEVILPFLKDRPQNLHRHPEGIHHKGFFQKDIASIFPHWLDTVKVFSKSGEKEIEYLLCQHEAALLYMANLGCIEINPWNSKGSDLDRPDYSVIDIDPSDTNTFEESIEVAMVAYSILNRASIPGYCKTSGSTGIHIYLPLAAKYTYEEARDFTKLLCYFIHEELPKLTSMERKVDKRKGKIYLDYLQNRKGQTLACAYCVRPKPGAPVSAPLEWNEVKPGLKMEDFNIFTMKNRIKEKPNLFQGILQKGLDMAAAIEKLT